MEENSVEQETPETEIMEDAAEHFTDTVSGNDAGPDTGLEPEAPQTEENGQGELLEKLDALVEALTPGEEETEEEPETDDIETLPSETEAATLELLEKIYAETASSRSADSLYYEAWIDWQAEEQKNVEASGKMDVYVMAVLLGILFLCACIAGIQVAKTIWERFR